MPAINGEELGDCFSIVDVGCRRVLFAFADSRRPEFEYLTLPYDSEEQVARQVANNRFLSPGTFAVDPAVLHRSGLN